MTHADRLRSVAALIDSVTKDDSGSAGQVRLISDLFVSKVVAAKLRSPSLDVEEAVADFERETRLSIARALQDRRGGMATGKDYYRTY